MLRGSWPELEQRAFRFVLLLSTRSCNGLRTIRAVSPSMDPLPIHEETEYKQSVFLLCRDACQRRQCERPRRTLEWKSGVYNDEGSLSCVFG